MTVVSALLVPAVSGAVNDGVSEQPAFNQQQTFRPYVEGELIVRFRPSSGYATQASAVSALGAVTAASTPQGTKLLRLPAGTTVEKALEQLSADGSVLYAEPNYLVTAAGGPAPVNDPRYGDQWGLPAIEAPAAWTWLSANVPAPQPRVIVAVIDSGIKLDHPELMPFLVSPGKDFVNEDDIAMDDGGHHGTHVAGIIAAAANNGLGVAGVAGQGQVGLLPVKVLDHQGNGNTFDVVQAIEWAVNQGAKVINLSLGSSQSAQSEADAVAYALHRGVTVVAASGNHGQGGASDPLTYPAAYPGVITVGAVGPDLQVAAFSGSGRTVDIVAPGVQVWSTYGDLYPEGTLTVGGTAYAYANVEYAGMGAVSGPLVDCGLALTSSSCAANPAGPWVALVDRGQVTFAEKIQNVMVQGAAAAIVVNSLAEGKPDDPGSFTLSYPQNWIPVLSVSSNSGVSIRAGQPTVALDLHAVPYAPMNGTSMATPHVAAAAALLTYAYPDLTPHQIATRLTGSAMDLGAIGWDSRSGHGLLKVADALAAPAPAVEFVAPGAGTTVTGQLQLQVLVAQPSQVASVSLEVIRVETGALVKTLASVAGAAGLYEATWDTTAEAQGEYKLVAIGRDAGGGELGRNAVEVVVNHGATGLKVRATKPDGTAAAGALVKLYRHDAGETSLVFQGNADGNGAIDFPPGATAYPTGTYTVTLMTQVINPVTQAPEPVLYVAAPTVPSLVQFSGAEARPVLVNASTLGGAPLGGAEVWVTRAGVPTLVGMLGEGGTGRYHLMPGTYDLAVTHQDPAYILVQNGVTVGTPDGGDAAVTLAATPATTSQVSVDYQGPHQVTWSAVAVSARGSYHDRPFARGTTVVASHGSYDANALFTVNDGQGTLWTYGLLESDPVTLASPEHTIVVSPGLTVSLTLDQKMVEPGQTLSGPVAITVPSGQRLVYVDNGSDAVHPTLYIDRLLPDDYEPIAEVTHSELFRFMRWQAPPDAIMGVYSATVEIDAGPLGAEYSDARFAVRRFHQVWVDAPYDIPAEGATARVWTYGEDGEWRRVYRATVGEDGLLSLPLDLPLATTGKHALQIEGRITQDGGSEEAYAYHRPFSTLSQVVQVTAAGTRKLTLAVQDASGSGMENMKIEASPAQIGVDNSPESFVGPVGLGATGPDGTAVAWLDAGDYHFGASGNPAAGGPGYILVKRNVSVPVSAEPLSVSLSAAGAVPVAVAAEAPIDHLDLIMIPAGTRLHGSTLFEAAAVAGQVYVTPGTYTVEGGPEFNDGLKNRWFYYASAGVHELSATTAPSFAFSRELSAQVFVESPVLRRGDFIYATVFDSNDNQVVWVLQEKSDKTLVDIPLTMTAYRLTGSEEQEVGEITEIDFLAATMEVPVSAEPGTYKVRAGLTMAGQPVYDEQTFTIDVPADLNGDGAVTKLDLDLLAGYVGQAMSDPALRSIYDLHSDGKIDLLDLYYIARRIP